MSGVLVQRRCEVPVEAVFEVLANGWAYASWVVGASAIRDVDDGWPGVGSRIHHAVGVWPLLLNDTTSVLEVVRPKRIMLRAQAWPVGEGIVCVQLDRDGDGCMVRMFEDASQGAARLIPAPLRRLMLVPRNRESLRRLEFQARQYL